MRHPEPDFVRQWRDIIRAPHTHQNPPIPRCCHTCLLYRDDGVCAFFEASPPAEFAAAQDACPEWVDELLF